MATRREQVVSWVKTQVAQGREINRGIRDAALSRSLSPYHYMKPIIQAASGVGDPPTAPTPNEVIYTRRKMKLRHYRPEVRRHKTPILFVYSLINRYYILDFLPGRSLIEYMVEQGYDVYAIDWGTPGEAEARLTWEDYMQAMKMCTRWALRTSGAEDLTLYGYCMGGTMALAYAALHPEGIRNFVAQAVPVDFHQGGIFAKWTDPRWFNVDQMVDAYGNVPVELMESGFSAMAPIQRMTKWFGVLRGVDNPRFVQTFMAMEEWASDNIPFPGEVYRQYIKDCYQENNLYEGRMKIGGQRVDLSSITASVLSVVAEKDSIAPPPCSIVLNDMVATDDTAVLRFNAGHIGLSTSSKGRKIFWPQVAAWIADHSEPMDDMDGGVQDAEPRDVALPEEAEELLEALADEMAAQIPGVKAPPAEGIQG